MNPKIKLNKSDKLIFDIFRLCDKTIWLEDFKEFQTQFESILRKGGYNLWRIYFGVETEREWREKCLASWTKYDKAYKKKKSKEKDSKHYYIKNRKYKVNLR